MTFVYALICGLSVENGTFWEAFMVFIDQGLKGNCRGRIGGISHLFLHIAGDGQSRLLENV
jgi:hypothetical protein